MPTAKPRPTKQPNPTTLRLPAPLLAELRRLSKLTGIPQSRLTIDALAEYLPQVAARFSKESA